MGKSRFASSSDLHFDDVPSNLCIVPSNLGILCFEDVPSNLATTISNFSDRDPPTVSGRGGIQKGDVKTKSKKPRRDFHAIGTRGLANKRPHTRLASNYAANNRQHAWSWLGLSEVPSDLASTLLKSGERLELDDVPSCLDSSQIKPHLRELFGHSLGSAVFFLKLTT